MSARASSTMTLLFTDIEGSTRRWEEMPGMHEQVEQHFAVLRDAVVAHRGTVFSTMGDGIAAAFSSAGSAIDAAVDAQRAMAAIGVSVRMGVHTGEVERVGDDCRGRAVNRAARIMAVGHGGQILLSDVTASLVRTGQRPVGAIDLGTHRLRDLIEPERLWQVLHPDLASSFPAVRGLEGFSNNLPRQRSSLVGREAEVARIVRLLDAHRLVTLTGVGGVGKTRLALQAGAELLSHFDKVWLAELASVVDPDDVADSLVRALGTHPGGDAVDAVTALLGQERVLLIVDNCEHVIDTVADLVDRLTAMCPRLTVVATSREALGIDGEHVVQVRSLAPDTAAELFVQRLESAGADIEQADRSDIELVCGRLDGIPLAIELAAARAATLGVSTVLGALDDRLDLLRGGRRRAMDRQHTMRATLDWSYRLLSHHEQQLFQRLAVWPNGFELDAAVHVGTLMGLDAAAATDHVTSLVQKSMVVADPMAHGIRYRMFETMRAFGLERLDERGERAEASWALADWVATLTDLAYGEPCSAAVERTSMRLEREVESWREAVMLAAKLRSCELAGRLCGPPTAYFLLGRHDLAADVEPLVELCPPAGSTGSPTRRAVIVCLLVAAAGASAPELVDDWVAEVLAVDEAEHTGIGTLMLWLVLTWRGDFGTSVEVCTNAVFDSRLPQTSRDMLLGIAVLDRFSLTDSSDDPHGLIERALDVADRSDVALHRVTCRLGAAWGLVASDPMRAMELVQRALADIEYVPALTRLTLPGSASRLLTNLDAQVAARGLLDQIDVSSSRSFVDLVPVFYATTLLDRVGHPAASAALATLSRSQVAPYLSMMDALGQAARASTSDTLSLCELETTVRAALAEVAGETVAGETVAGETVAGERFVDC
jgi:predicted ATPase/class 3 adenylate cyclase